MFGIKICFPANCLGQTLSFLLPSCQSEKSPPSPATGCPPQPHCQFNTSKCQRQLKLAFPASFAAITWTCDPLLVTGISDIRYYLATQGKTGLTIKSEICEAQAYFPFCIWKFSCEGRFLSYRHLKIRAREKSSRKANKSLPMQFWYVIKRTFYCLSSLVLGHSVTCRRNHPSVNLSDPKFPTRTYQLK